MKSSLLLFLLFLAACAAPAEAPRPAQAEAPSEGVWSYPEAASALSAASCPADVRAVPPMEIGLGVEPVSIGKPKVFAEAAPGLSLAGGWALTSDKASFGGLSGLDVLDDGNLLAVSDGGAFFWIGLEDGVPASAKMAFISGPEGNYLTGKRAGDAEGLAVRGGLAFVSFERDHRVAAFNLAGCGAAARAAAVARLDVKAPAFDNAPEANRGAEALSLFGDALVAGFEDSQKGGAAAGLVGGAFSARIPQEALTLLVGMDTLGDTAYTLHRAYIPGLGNVILIQSHKFAAEDGALIVSDTKRLALLPNSLNLDNFEGLAAHEMEDGTTRLYIVSDDNFSARQRTLLYAFNVVTTP